MIAIAIIFLGFFALVGWVAYLDTRAKRIEAAEKSLKESLERAFRQGDGSGKDTE